MAKKLSERKEAWFRIIVSIISGITLRLWYYLIVALSIINWFITIFSEKRNKEIAECETILAEMDKLKIVTKIEETKLA